MTYPKLQATKEILSYPIRLALIPLMLVIAFAGTNWADDWDVEYFKKTMRGLYRLRGNRELSPFPHQAVEDLEKEEVRKAEDKEKEI